MFRRSLWMIEDFEHSLRLLPDDGELNYALALIHVIRGRFNNAINILRQAVEANP